MAVVTQPIKLQTKQSVKRNTICTKQVASPEEIKQVQNEIKDKLDSINETSELTSMHLQMMMDRRNKLDSALINNLKKSATHRMEYC